MASATLMAQNHTNYELRYPSNPEDTRTYDTNRLRKAFAIEKVFSADEVNIVYTIHDRFIIGGAMPVNNKALQLETFEYLKAPNFLSRREIGIINVGGTGTVTVKEGNKEKTYELKYKEALYVGSGKHEVYFASKEPAAHPQSRRRIDPARISALIVFFIFISSFMCRYLFYLS